jgi:hypothetical protein
VHVFIYLDARLHYNWKLGSGLILLAKVHPCWLSNYFFAAILSTTEKYIFGWNDSLICTFTAVKNIEVKVRRCQPVLSQTLVTTAIKLFCHWHLLRKARVFVKDNFFKAGQVFLIVPLEWVTIRCFTWEGSFLTRSIKSIWMKLVRIKHTRFSCGSVSDEEKSFITLVKGACTYGRNLYRFVISCCVCHCPSLSP